MALKQSKTIFDSGTAVNGRAATLAFTSDPIEFVNNSAWSVNVWFASLAFSGAPPTVTLQVSNVTDSNSFNNLTGAVGLPMPDMIKDTEAKYRFWRVVYDPKTASSGTINVDLIQEV